jgi:hypothetical protein
MELLKTSDLAASLLSEPDGKSGKRGFHLAGIEDLPKNGLRSSFRALKSCPDGEKPDP